MLDTPIVLEDPQPSGAGLRRPRGARRGAAGRLAAPFPADVLDGLPGRSLPRGVGRLIAPEVADADARTVMTLERAAQALALHRMVEQNRSSLELRAQSGLVDDLRRGRVVDEAEATARAHALGLRPALTYVPMTARLSEGAGTDQVLVQQRRVRTLDAVMHAIRSAGHTGLAASRDDGQIDLVLAPQGHHRRGGFAGRRADRGMYRDPARRRARRRCRRLPHRRRPGVEPADRRRGRLGRPGIVAEVAMSFASRGPQRGQALSPGGRHAVARADLIAPVRPTGTDLRRDRARRTADPPRQNTATRCSTC